MIKETVMNRLIHMVLKKKGTRALDELDRNCETAIDMSRDLLMKILQDNKDTEYGRKYGFADITSVEEYRQKVPFSVYDDYAPYIERMIKNNETDLISVYPAVHYALSSGSVGVPKSIPVSEHTVECYGKYSANMVFGVMDRYCRKTFGRYSPKGRGINPVEVRSMQTENGVPKGTISARSLNTLKKFIPYIFSPPPEIMFTKEHMDLKYLHIRFALADRNLMFMMSAFMTALADMMTYMETNWESLCREIEYGTLKEDANIPDDVRKALQAKIKPDPKRAAELRCEFAKGFDTPVVPRIWRNMTWIFAIGTGGFSGYTEKMRRYTGDMPILFSVYAASEALVAAAVNVNEEEFVLIPDSGFYEFVPMDSDDENTTYTIDQLEPGKDYEIIITNLSGFYRYRIKDVVRITGFYKQSPKLKFVYRKNQMISIAGEKTNDEAVSWAVSEFAKEAGCGINDYSVEADTDSQPGRYIIYMEPDRIMPKEKTAEYTRLIEEKLSLANPSFGDKVKNGVLGSTVLHFEQQETYALYRDMMIMRGISGNQLKPVRVIDTPVKKKFFSALIEK